MSVSLKYVFVRLSGRLLYDFGVAFFGYKMHSVSIVNLSEFRGY